MPRVPHALSHLINGRLRQDQKPFQTLASENDKAGLHPQHSHVLVLETQHLILGCKRFLPQQTGAWPFLCSPILPHLVAIISRKAGYSLTAMSQFDSYDLLKCIWYPLRSCSYLSLLILINSPTRSQRIGRSRFTCIEHNQGLS